MNNSDSGSRDAENGVKISPNIKFVGRSTWDQVKRKIIREVNPIESLRTAGRVIELPPADFQKERRLFYHPDARKIAKSFPHLYKIVLPKSSKRSK